jgi:hypothetical protein
MPRLPGLVALALALFAGALLALIAGRPRWRRVFAMVLALTTLPLPFLSDGPALLRGLIALATTLIVFRAIDLQRQPSRSPTRRVWHVLGVVDTRHVARVDPSLRVASLVRVLVAAGPTLAGLWVASRLAPTMAAPLGSLLRWIAGVGFCYGAFETIVGIVELIHAALGLRPPVIHDAPIRARTIDEFWGRRWNRIVGTWLRATCFVPLARRGHPALGMVAAFAASVVLHAYVAWAALGAQAALIVGGFFAVQLPLLSLERRLQVARWPALAARAWTLGVLLLVSPLFVLPALAVFDPLLR